MTDDGWPPSTGLRIVGFFLFCFVTMFLPALVVPFLPADEAALERFMLRVFLPGLAVYVPVLFLVWTRVGSSVATIPPAPASAPVTLADLRTRLLALQDLDVPLSVTESGRDGLVLGWKVADAKWLGVLTAATFQFTHYIRIRFDETTHTVRVQDVAIKKESMLNLAQGRASFAVSGFKGISFFQYSRGFDGGVIYRDGEWTVGSAYDYRFDLRELKNPLIQVIGRNGWTYKPVVTFWRWLGG